MKKLLIILGLAIWVVLIILTPPKSGAEVTPAPEAAKSSARRASAAPVERPGSARPQQGMADDERRDEVRQAIEAAVMTYSPEGVKAIRPYLDDADPEIRGMARDGMVQLGEQDAIPLLREAALHRKDQSEIASLREAADLLALPAWSSSEEAATVIAEIMDDTSR
jgi:hypothetical protein